MELEQNNTLNNDCSDRSTFGQKSYQYDYIVKSLNGEDNYPDEACNPWLHANAQFDNLQVNGTVAATNFQGTINVQSWKGFDVPHPSKDNYRLRHICLEGPEGAVYIRGRLKGNNVIELPQYWHNFVDMESITVQLTQIGYTQDLIVEPVQWGKYIKVRSGNGTTIDCYYTVFAERIDGEKLIVEYEGQTPADYPGDNTQYSLAGYHYDARGKGD